MLKDVTYVVEDDVHGDLHAYIEGTVMGDTAVVGPMRPLHYNVDVGYFHDKETKEKITSSAHCFIEAQWENQILGINCKVAK